MGLTIKAWFSSSVCKKKKKRSLEFFKPVKNKFIRNHALSLTGA
jgi:hypothetical protein